MNPFDSTLHQAFDAANGWELSGTGPDYRCTQTVAVSIPGAGPYPGEGMYSHAR